MSIEERMDATAAGTPEMRNLQHAASVRDRTLKAWSAVARELRAGAPDHPALACVEEAIETLPADSPLWLRFARGRRSAGAVVGLVHELKRDAEAAMAAFRAEVAEFRAEVAEVVGPRAVELGTEPSGAQLHTALCDLLEIPGGRGSLSRVAAEIRRPPESYRNLTSKPAITAAQAAGVVAALGFELHLTIVSPSRGLEELGPLAPLVEAGAERLVKHDCAQTSPEGDAYERALCEVRAHGRTIFLWQDDLEHKALGPFVDLVAAGGGTAAWLDLIEAWSLKPHELPEEVQHVSFLSPKGEVIYP